MSKEIYIQWEKEKDNFLKTVIYQRKKNEYVHFISLGEKLGRWGDNRLIELGDLPAIILKGKLFDKNDFLYYYLGFFEDYVTLGKDKLVCKVLEALSEVSILTPNRNIDWMARVKSTKYLAFPLFTYHAHYEDLEEFYGNEKYDEIRYQRIINVVVLWKVKTEIGNFTEIEVVFLKNLNFNAVLSASVLSSLEDTPELLYLIYRNPKVFLNAIIDGLLVNKPDYKKQELKDLAFKALEAKGVEITREFILGNLENIIKTVKQAIRAKPKRKKKTAVIDRKCIMCGKQIKKGNYCNTCYPYRWHALLLAEELKDRNLVDKFLVKKLTKEEKQAILENIRPSDTRYSFNHFERQLRKLINLASEKKDKKLYSKLKALSFI